MKVDIILCYEHWQRELNALIKLKSELEIKGYKVKMLNIQPGIPRFLESYLFEPDIVFFPWVYSDREVKRARDFRGNCQKIINAQCEQILSVRAQKTGFFRIRDNAINAFHISWGERSTQRYKEWGVQEDHIWNVGNINLEINDKKFDHFFLSRKYIADTHGLDFRKKWLLFCSNFKFAEMYYHEIEKIEKRSPGILKLAKEMKNSKKEIINWIKEYLSTHKDIEIIYRPHPIEKRDRKLEEIQEQYQGFKYLSDYSVNQWVRVCDAFVSWGSTAIIDSVYLNKLSAYLIPGIYPDVLRGDIEGICPIIDSYNKFEEFLDQDTGNQGSELSALEKHIFFQEDSSIEKICEMIEQLYAVKAAGYFPAALSDYVKWRHLSLKKKKELIGFWLAKYFKLYLLPGEKKRVYEEAYHAKKREREICRLMKKGMMNNEESLFRRK